MEKHDANTSTIASPEMIVTYSREQAILDGVLVDVTETAFEAGLKYPTAVTAAVWNTFVAVPEDADWQDEEGRLWDILWMLRTKILSTHGHASELEFSVVVQNSKFNPKMITLKAVCGPNDDGSPAITVMLPNED